MFSSIEKNYVEQFEKNCERINEMLANGDFSSALHLVLAHSLSTRMMIEMHIRKCHFKNKSIDVDVTVHK